MKLLTIEAFKQRLNQFHRPDWLRVAVNIDNEAQLFIVGYGGMGTLISLPIVNYPIYIKQYVVQTIKNKKLVLAKEKYYLADQNKDVYFLVNKGIR